MSQSAGAPAGRSRRTQRNIAMERNTLAQLFDVLAVTASRRGIVAALSGGLLAINSLALGRDEAGARQNHHHQRKKHRRRKKRGNPRRAVPTSPSPMIVADAACGAIPNNSNEADGIQRLAQTFTALGSGPLVRVDLRIVKSVGQEGDYVLRLSPLNVAGLPTNTVLVETMVAGAIVPVGESSVSFAFATPFSLVAGTQYALILTRPGGDGFKWLVNDDDLCAGQSFVALSQTGQFTELTGDFIFTTFISA
jgi:hypothetical protein